MTEQDWYKALMIVAGGGLLVAIALFLFLFGVVG